MIPRQLLLPAVAATVIYVRVREISYTVVDITYNSTTESIRNLNLDRSIEIYQ